jgi:hypothetical protein
MGVIDRIRLVQHRDLWCAVMKRVMNIPTLHLWRTVGVAMSVVWTGTGWTRMRPHCQGEVNSLVTG